MLQPMARLALVPPLLAALLALAACGSDDSAAETAPAVTASGTTGAKPSAASGVRLLSLGRFDAPVYVTAPP
ncbi:MAG: hypothetical protein QOD24_4042, partial [Solirubrobacteraceae bacterium]|nr:hypothetical protein [Solirubrobacteraceae bacterium]